MDIISHSGPLADGTSSILASVGDACAWTGASEEAVTRLGVYVTAPVAGLVVLFFAADFLALPLTGKDRRLNVAVPLLTV